MSYLDEQDKRIAKILGSEEPTKVEDKTLAKYLVYLKENLGLPCHLTGIEDFEWEEYYVIGPGSKKEYEKLRKKRPSYMDTFELIRFDDQGDKDYGIYVEVKRLSDKKKFDLPLADLKATDRKSKNYRLLDDFSIWFTNYR
jgi:hypothetical protein